MAGTIKVYNTTTKQWELVDAGAITDGKKKIAVEDIENIEKKIPTKLSELDKDIELGSKEILPRITEEPIEGELYTKVLKGATLELLDSDTIEADKNNSELRISFKGKKDAEEIRAEVKALTKGDVYFQATEKGSGYFRVDVRRAEGDVISGAWESSLERFFYHLEEGDSLVFVSTAGKWSGKFVSHDGQKLILNSSKKQILASVDEVPTKLSDLAIDLELGKDYDREIEELKDKKADKSELPEEISDLTIDDKAIELISNLMPGQNIYVGSKKPEALKDDDVWIKTTTYTTQVGPGFIDFVEIEIIIDGKVYYSSIDIGKLKDLETDNNQTIVNAINEVKRSTDDLKQSGAESNKILSEALSSKGVEASEKDSIKVNANKVNDIKIGDYSIGDVLEEEDVEVIIVDIPPTVLWEFTEHTSWLKSVAVDNDGYVYSGSSDKKVMKISPSGSKVWEFTGNNNGVNSVAVDSDGYVYSGSSNRKVMKISPSGSKVWEFTGNTDDVDSVAVGNDGYVYSGSYDKKVMKISPSGSKVWEFTGHTNSVKSVAVDSDGYVYSSSYDKKVMKISPSGSKVWEFTGHTDGVNSVAVDNDGYVYSGSSDEKVMKISPSGSKVWEFTGNTNGVNSVAVDNDGYVYSGSSNGKVMKISPSGSKVWEFTRNTSVSSVAVDNDGYVYLGSFDRKVMKIKDFKLLYKILK